MDRNVWMSTLDAPSCCWELFVYISGVNKTGAYILRHWRALCTSLPAIDKSNIKQHILMSKHSGGCPEATRVPVTTVTSDREWESEEAAMRVSRSCDAAIYFPPTSLRRVQM
jgi:hypothetical protein